MMLVGYNTCLGSIFKKVTAYTKACLVWLMFVCRLGKKDFIEILLVLFVSSNDFMPK